MIVIDGLSQLIRLEVG